MSLLEMPDVTLVIFNPAHGPDVSARVLNHCMSMIRFGDVVHIADRAPEVPCAARFVRMERTTWKGAQEFQSLRLGKFFSTKWVLHVETDGFPMNPGNWSDEFYGYDYVGAPWPDDVVGNGGCSLQSRAFRDKVESMGSCYQGDASDVWFCRMMRGEVVQAGLKYAPPEVAIRFSYESDTRTLRGWDKERSFGFHGRMPRFAQYLKVASGGA
jgi:hypothetical protein